MKRLAQIIAVLFITASFIPVNVNAQTSSKKLQEIEESNATLQASVDSLSALSSELFKVVSENTEAVNSLKKEINNKQNVNYKAINTFSEYSEIVMGWVCLLIFAIFLPLLLVNLYLRQSKEKQRRYDIIVDLVRSGVEIKPELQEYLTGVSKTSAILNHGPLSGMNQSDLNYCSRRLLWGVFTILGGIIMGILTNEEGFVLVIGCVGLFFIAQAVIRYFGVKYYRDRTLKQNNSEDAQ